MKKILIIFIFLLTQCGYQPIYINKNLVDLEFYKITLEGDADINRKIDGSLSLNENKLNAALNSLLINSKFEIKETSKNSKGEIESYKSQITLNLIISNKERIIDSKIFFKESHYNVKDNKYDLVQYQNDIKNNLINDIIEDIILYMNIKK
jgi:hypothetical protein